MAQDSVLERDLICVLFGCSIHVILREIDGHYILISDAYVSGYMYGEGIEELMQWSLHSEFCSKFISGFWLTFDWCVEGLPAMLGETWWVSLISSLLSRDQNDEQIYYSRKDMGVQEWD